jgi:uncharacterized cupredoxin-like copper-binding protein
MHPARAAVFRCAECACQTGFFENPITADSGQTVTITAHDIYFEPAEVHVKAGKVTFNLPNEGAAEHDFSIDDLGIQVNLPAGSTQTVEADIPAGRYDFYCNIPGHKDAGMVGTLVVE